MQWPIEKRERLEKIEVGLPAYSFYPMVRKVAKILEETVI
jgi:hypothetical protein